MRLDYWNTISEIKSAKPHADELRENKNKQWRESWVAAKFCESLKWESALILSPYKDLGDDVIVKFNDERYPFQVAEIAPKDPLVVRELPKSKMDEGGYYWCEVHGSLSPQLTTLVSSLVKKKDTKNYSNQENMNLLIYMNPPGAIIIDGEIDIDIPSLLRASAPSKFKTISLYENGNVIFIKGEISSLARLCKAL